MKKKHVLWYFEIPKFAPPQMVGNPICKQIDWDDDPSKVLAWKEARTGFPYIDAIMTQGCIYCPKYYIFAPPPPRFPK